VERGYRVGSYGLGSYDKPIRGYRNQREVLRTVSQDHNQAAYDEGLYHDGSGFAGVDYEAYHQAWSANTLAEEEPPNEVPYEDCIGYDGQGSEEEDVMLEFNEGRTLSMSMGEGILAEKPRKPGTGGLHPKPYRLHYGQSVDEIEIVVGKNLGNLWKR
jgi:hypothetical protein